MGWTRLAWLVYTVAMGLGGIWAYFTLGFGGYWAWDPVEVANLLPWLALTVLLHAQLHHARHGRHADVGPFLALLPLLLVILSTLSTRSGLWVSVHAFTDPTNTFNADPAAQFLAILDAEPGLGRLLAFDLALLLGGTALWGHWLARRHGRGLGLSRVLLAVGLGATGAILVAPASVFSLLLEGAHGISGGRPGLGLLILAFAWVLTAATPFFLVPGHASKWRLDIAHLNQYAVLVLGAGLMAIFLFHMAVDRALGQAFYEAALPVLAAPALLGILTFQSLGTFPRRYVLAVPAVALVAAVAAARWAPGPWRGSFLVVLAGLATLVGLERVRRASTGTRPRTEQIGYGLLALAALLDLVFWLNPPSHQNLLGLEMNLKWPVQFFAGGAALALLWLILAAGAGRAIPIGPVALATAALLGFYVAAPLALAGWWILRNARPAAHKTAGGPSPAVLAGRMQQVGLHLAHAAVGLAILGYAASLLYSTHEVAELRAGETIDAGGYNLRLEDVALRERMGLVVDVSPHVVVEGAGTTQGRFAWEDQPGLDSYFAKPSLMRLWDRDLYLVVEAVHLGDGACGGNRTVEAFQAARPMCAGDPVTGVRVSLTVLPFVGLVWTALALFATAMALRLNEQGPESRRAHGTTGEGPGTPGPPGSSS